MLEGTQDTTPPVVTEVPATPAPVAPDAAAPVVPEPPKESASKAYAAAARREKALQRQRDEIAAQRAEIAREKAEIEARAKEYDTKFGSKPKNPIEALMQAGFSYKDATEFVLNDSRPTAEQMATAADDKIKALEDRIEADKKATLEQAEKDTQAQLAQVVQEYRDNIQTFIGARPDDYELITLHKMNDEVYNLIEENFTATQLQDEKTRKLARGQGVGKVLSIKEAADMVEKYLEEQVEKSYSTKKFQAKLGTKTPTDPKQQPKAPAPQRPTISNGLTPTAPTLVSSPAIEDDRMRRAMAALGG